MEGKERASRPQDKMKEGSRPQDKMEERQSAVTYKVVDQPWSPSDPTTSEAMLNATGQDGWYLVMAYPDPLRERTRWIFRQ